MTVAMLHEHEALISSYARFLHRHYQRMFNGLLPLTVDDFVQTARIAVWQSPDHERVVIRAVIKWRCADAVRKVAGRPGHTRKITATVSLDYENDDGATVGHTIADRRDDYAASDTRMLVRDVLDLADLTEREREVLLDHLRGVRQCDTADRLGVSRCRISQLLAKAQAKARLVVSGGLE